MDDKQKSENRWHITKWVLGFLGMFCIGVFCLGWGGNVEAVKALTPIGYSMFGFAAALMGVNLATPAGGFSQGKDK